MILVAAEPHAPTSGLLPFLQASPLSWLPVEMTICASSVSCFSRVCSETIYTHPFFSPLRSSSPTTRQRRAATFLWQHGASPSSFLFVKHPHPPLLLPPMQFLPHDPAALSRKLPVAAWCQLFQCALYLEAKEGRHYSAFLPTRALAHAQRAWEARGTTTSLHQADVQVRPSHSSYRLCFCSICEGGRCRCSIPTTPIVSLLCCHPAPLHTMARSREFSVVLHHPPFIGVSSVIFKVY